jgi:hypothetical protein
MTTYYLDGDPVEWTRLIAVAKEAGYHDADGIYCTSGAAAHLRSLGHEVTDTPPVSAERDARILEAIRDHARHKARKD